MAQLKKVVEPFGEVNVFPQPGGAINVVATILMEPEREGAQTGIALDGSGSMRKLFGQDAGGGAVSSIFAKKKLENIVAPVAQSICAYLARKIDADGGTTCIYWAVGPNGMQTEVVGDFTASQAETHPFTGPKDFGTGTQLLPAVRYFVERFSDASWGFYVFVTDGELYDLEEVKQYTIQIAREIAAGRRRPVKFVLLGVGPDVNEKQMEDLDDLDTGTDLDLWDHKLASEMRQLADIFAEVVDRNARVAESGRILDAAGKIVRNYSDTGLPALLKFTMPAGSTYFTLEVDGSRIHQPLADNAVVPADGAKPAAPAPVAAPAKSEAPVAVALAPAASPVPIPPPTPAPAAAPVTAKVEDDEPKEIELDLTKMIDLEFDVMPSGKSDDKGMDFDLEKA